MNGPKAISFGKEVLNIGHWLFTDCIVFCDKGYLCCIKGSIFETSYPFPIPTFDNIFLAFLPQCNTTKNTKVNSNGKVSSS